jgi:hypothetical protein
MEPVVEKYKVKKDEGPLNEGECVDLIVELSKSYPLTTIIVDGLDECRPKIWKALLTRLKEVLERSDGLVKILVSSRTDQVIREQIEGDLAEDSPHINVTADKNAEDIRRFVQKEVEKASQPVKRDPILKQTIIDTLIDRAQGM